MLVYVGDLMLLSRLGILRKTLEKVKEESERGGMVESR